LTGPTEATRIRLERFLCPSDQANPIANTSTPGLERNQRCCIVSGPATPVRRARSPVALRRRQDAVNPCHAGAMRHHEGPS